MFKLKKITSIIVLPLPLCCLLLSLQVFPASAQSHSFMGAATWDQTYGGTNADRADSLVQTLDGGYAMAGSTLTPDDYYRDFWLVKTDSNGNMEWNRTYGEVGVDEFAHSMVQTLDGGFAIAGYSISLTGIPSYGGNFWLVKTDEQSVIPELPSLIFPLLFLAITLLVVALKKRIRYLFAT